jgi:hypothetical protein
VSVVDRVLGSVKDLIVMREQLDRLAEDVSGANTEIRDHEKRLIRIETIIEMSGKAARRRLPNV